MGIYKVIGSNGNEIHSDSLIHPGRILEKELLAREITKSKFAMSIGMYPAHFSDILKGKRNITEDIAIKLEAVLEISAEFWMRVQVAYNIGLIRKNKSKKAASTC